MHKTLNYSIQLNKKHCQYKSNKVNSTATNHSLCPGNGRKTQFVHEKLITLYVCVLTTTKTTLKSTTKHNFKKH